MSKSASKILLWSLLLAPASSLAVPITVDFTVRAHNAFDGQSFNQPSYAGFELGTLGSGSFTFDDSFGAFTDTGTGLEATDLTFSWLGHTFTQDTARIWTLGFNAEGGLNRWGIGAPYCTLACIGVPAPSPTDFHISAFEASATQGSLASMHVEGFTGHMLGLVSWTAHSASVPEPASLALLSLGLVGIAVARRQRDVKPA